MSRLTEFMFPGISTCVIFGRGSKSNTSTEIEWLGHKKALVLAAPHQAEEAEKLANGLGVLSAGVFAGAIMHTPVEITEQALAVCHNSGATAIVSLGGGSTTGLGKAIATRSGADQIAIPTTYAGSEMTDILGETRNGEKLTRRDESIRPETVICDVDLTLTLPADMTVTAALNAIAHGAEALYAPDRNPVIETMCVDALILFKQALPVLMRDPRDLDARAKMLQGAWFCSTALSYVSMALHHKLCHTLGCAFNMPHAETHAIMIPHTTSFNAKAVPDLLAPLGVIFGSTLGTTLYDFAKSVGAPPALKDFWTFRKRPQESRRPCHAQLLCQPTSVQQIRSANSSAGSMGQQPPYTLATKHKGLFVGC